MKIELHLADSTSPEKDRLLIDGVDVSDHVLENGLKVEIGEQRQPLLHLTLAPNVLHLTGDSNLDVTLARIIEAADEPSPQGVERSFVPTPGCIFPPCLAKEKR